MFHVKRHEKKYTNPITSRGLMYDEKGSPVTAKIEGGPLDRSVVHLEHQWMLGRSNVEIEGNSYRLLCGRSGFFMVWLGKPENNDIPEQPEGDKGDGSEA